VISDQTNAILYQLSLIKAEENIRKFKP